MSAVDAPGRALTAERSFDRTSVAAVSASLGAMLVLLAWGALHDSPTVDEPNHIVRGMALGRTGDARLSFAHPPLANGLQALPVIVLGTSLPIEELEGWEEWAIETTVDSAAAHDYAAFRSAIVQGRFVTMALTIALGLYLFFFVREFFGVVAARFAIVIYALHPVFLAHGRLVTTDLPVTLGTLLFTGELVRYLGSRRRLHLFTLGLSLAFACTVKFSGLFLVPPFAFAMAWAALRGSGRFPRELPRGRRLCLCARDFAIVGLITWAAVNASYGFERTGMTVEQILAHEPEPDNWILRRAEGQLLEKISFLPSLPGWLPVPLPYSFVYGLFTIQAQNSKGHSGWFMGKESWDGNPLYFPIMFVLKNPAALVLLLGIGVVLAWRRRGTLGHVACERLGHPLVVVPLFLSVLLLGTKIQIGIRHAMPIFPFLVLLAALVAAEIWSEGRRGRGVALGLVGLLALEAIATQPHQISHFNWLVGGPAVGHRISMVGEDWGQDLAEVARLVREEKLEPLHYFPYVPVMLHELSHFGAHAVPIRCGDPAPSHGWYATHAASALRSKDQCVPIDRNRPPDRIVNRHVWLYRIGP